VLPLNYAGPHGMLAGDSMFAALFSRPGRFVAERNPLCGGIRSGRLQLARSAATPGTPLRRLALAKPHHRLGEINATVCTCT